MCMCVYVCVCVRVTCVLKTHTILSCVEYITVSALNGNLSSTWRHKRRRMCEGNPKKRVPHGIHINMFCSPLQHSSLVAILLVRHKTSSCPECTVRRVSRECVLHLNIQPTRLSWTERKWFGTDWERKWSTRNRKMFCTCLEHWNREDLSKRLNLIKRVRGRICSKLIVLCVDSTFWKFNVRRLKIWCNRFRLGKLFLYFIPFKWNKYHTSKHLSKT